MMTTRQRADLTFKDNLKRIRHGWVRLTPAYSVKIVEELIRKHPDIGYILEPFSGTGTTGLVAAQYGLQCDLYDINPFLLWLAKVKCANYSSNQIKDARQIAHEVVNSARRSPDSDDLWVPPISNIERWWSPRRLIVLAKIFQSINDLLPKSCQEKDLLLVGFCRLIIQWSNAAFNHQSMSFKENDNQLRLFDEDEEIYQVFLNDLEEILLEASCGIKGGVRTHLLDSRNITVKYPNRGYDAVITSPPYVNRMSYIRELRPYMYWLGYLKEAREAGELDWEAIGGTWGIATSRLNDWKPDNELKITPRLTPLIEEIAQSSEVLSRYVHKYFTDMSSHFSNLYNVVAPGGRLYYIVGNSKFYNTLVPAEELYVDLMKSHGFENTNIKVIRKRNSKKELFEFLVSATKPL
jgi:SAM-dependent methyltransferase